MRSRFNRALLMRQGRFSLSGHIYFITTSTKYREPIFLDHYYAQVAISGFTEPKLLKNNELISWVLMPDHVHWLLQLGTGQNLSKLISGMKSASSRLVRQAGYQKLVWGKGYHDRRLRHYMDIPNFAHYILNNPVKANMVSSAKLYPYSYANPHAVIGKH